MATLEELKFELFLRKRNSGELTWKTKSGKTVPIKDLTTEHLENIIKMHGRIKNNTTLIKPSSLNFY